MKQPEYDNSEQFKFLLVMEPWKKSHLNNHPVYQGVHPPVDPK